MDTDNSVGKAWSRGWVEGRKERRGGWGTSIKIIKFKTIAYIII